MSGASSLVCGWVATRASPRGRVRKDCGAVLCIVASVCSQAKARDRCTSERSCWFPRMCEDQYLVSIPSRQHGASSSETPSLRTRRTLKTLKTQLPMSRYSAVLPYYLKALRGLWGRKPTLVAFVFTSAMHALGH